MDQKEPIKRYFIERYEPSIDEWWETFTTTQPNSRVTEKMNECERLIQSIQPQQRYRVVKETISYEVIYPESEREKNGKKESTTPAAASIPRGNERNHD